MSTSTCNKQFLPEWRSPQRALALQGEHCDAYTPTGKKVKLRKGDKVDSVLSLLSAYCGNYRPPQPPVCVEEENTHHTGSDQRAVLAKCFSACMKSIKKRRKYGDIPDSLS